MAAISIQATMNKSLIVLFSKPARALCLALMGLFIAACGAGTGGTGSGPPAAAGLGTVTSDVTPSAIDPRQPALGTWSHADISATFEANKITVTQGCAKFEFSGEWALDAHQQIQLQGAYSGCDADSASINANLVVQLNPAAAGATPRTLSVLITDATGHVLIYSPLLTKIEVSSAAPSVVNPTVVTAE
jgi:hypothetical protein